MSSFSLPISLASHDRSYTAYDGILYALGVGASLAEPQHYDLLCDTSPKFHILPTFGIIASQMSPTVMTGSLADALPFLKGYKPEQMVHAEHKFVLLKPLPVEAKCENTAVITEVYDKGKAALMTLRVNTRLKSDGSLLCYNEYVSYIIGKGNFGGPRGPSSKNQPFPARSPDYSRKVPVSVDQAALYRLSGDYNPLHIDNPAAKSSGFPKPILHGLCTLGMMTRVVLEEVANGDYSRLSSVEVRFTSPVYPGDTLTVDVWCIESETYRVKCSSKCFKLFHRTQLVCSAIERGKDVLSNVIVKLRPLSKI
jgi:acyl dehydratase